MEVLKGIEKALSNKASLVLQQVKQIDDDIYREELQHKQWVLNWKDELNKVSVDEGRY